MSTPRGLLESPFTEFSSARLPRKQRPLLKNVVNSAAVTPGAGLAPHAERARVGCPGPERAARSWLVLLGGGEVGAADPAGDGSGGEHGGGDRTRRPQPQTHGGGGLILVPRPPVSSAERCIRSAAPRTVMVSA